MRLSAPPHKLCLALAALSLVGCGIAFEQAQVRNEFAEHFDCAASSTRSAPGGYQVEGCGTVAFYRCSAPPAGHGLRFDRQSHEASVGGAMLEGFVSGALEGAFSEGQCVLERHVSEPGAVFAEREHVQARARTH